MILLNTYISGKEMSQQNLFTKEAKMQVYFCDAYNPWQRGTNENNSILIFDIFLISVILVNSRGRRSSIVKNS